MCRVTRETFSQHRRTNLYRERSCSKKPSHPTKSFLSLSCSSLCHDTFRIFLRSREPPCSADWVATGTKSCCNNQGWLMTESSRSPASGRSSEDVMVLFVSNNKTRRNIAPFSFCNKFVKPFCIESLLAHRYFNKFWTKWHYKHLLQRLSL